MNTSKFIRCGILASSLLLPLAFGACERHVVETTKTNSGPDGTTVQKEKTVQHDDGTVTIDKETHTEKP